MGGKGKDKQFLDKQRKKTSKNHRGGKKKRGDLRSSRCAPHLLPIYLISKMHTKTIQKIQKAYIKTYEKDVKIYKDIENSQGTLLLQKCRPLWLSMASRGPLNGVKITFLVLQSWRTAIFKKAKKKKAQDKYRFFGDSGRLQFHVKS